MMNNNLPTLNRSPNMFTPNNNVFNNINQFANQPTNNIFANNNPQTNNPTNNLFGNINPNNQNTTPNIFNNPNNQPQTTNIFGQGNQNPPANNIFGQQNIQNQPATNIFAQQGNQNQPTTNIFGQQANQNQPTNNIFGQQATIFNNQQNQPGTGNIFNQGNTGGNLNTGTLFNQSPGIQPNNLFNQQQNNNQIFGNQGIQGSNFQQNYTTFSELQLAENYIKAEKKGNFERLMAFYLQSLTLSQGNQVRNQKFRNLRFQNSIVMQPNQNNMQPNNMQPGNMQPNNQSSNIANSVNNNNHKKFIAMMQLKIQEVLADVKNKSYLKNIYNNDIDKINQNASKKLKFYKQAFLQIKSPSNIICQIEESLKYLQQLVEAQIKTYYVAHQSKRYSIYVKYPTNFQMKFTQNILKQVKVIIQKLKQYEICQQVMEPADVSEVISSLIEYYKNLTCLVYDFKQKYGEVKQQYFRTIKSTSVSTIEREIKNLRDQSLKNKQSIFRQIEQVEKTLKKKIERRNENKKIEVKMI